MHAAVFWQLWTLWNRGVIGHPPEWGRTMQGYRVFFIGSDDHIADRAEFFCSDDAAAKERAKQLTDGRDIELWRLDQQIARFDAKQQ